MIEVQDLCKSFGPTKAVDHVSFTVGRGEVVGFLGPNGAGKTTTMRILTCFLSPDSGTAKVGGYDVIKEPLQVRSTLGYLPEGAPSYDDMGVVDYLKFIGDMQGMTREKRDSRLHEMINVCGLKPVIHKDIAELSKGFRQRLGLAAAIIHDPQILILDEPTSGLDPKQNREIRELIKHIGSEKCVILSTHILPEVEVTCDRAIIINEGKVTAEGTVRELGRLARGGDTYYVKFKGDIGRIKERLEKSEQIEDFEERDVNGGYSFVLTGRSGDDISENIFDMAVEGGFKLIELRREAARLEEAFLRLTKADSPAAGKRKKGGDAGG